MANGNGGSRIIGNTEFYGGLATDNKIGIENSYADGECLDVRKSPSQMTVLPMSRKLNDAGVITGLITAMTQSKDGNIWGIDENGVVYKIDEDNAVSVVSNNHATSSGFSLEYSQIDDGLWFADGGHSLFSYGKIMNPSGASVDTYDFSEMQDENEYAVYAIETQTNGSAIYYHTNPDIKRSDGTQTWPVKTTVSELDADKALFLPGLVSTSKIGVYFTAVAGSGTVRIEVHDENNNVVASSAAVQQSSMSANSYTFFDVRPNPAEPVSAANQFNNYLPWAGDTIEAGAEYHIHIVASTAGFIARTSTANDISKSLDMQVYGYTLQETYNKKHPMCMFDKLYIGNGRYVSTKETSPLSYINDTLLIQDGLRLDDGYEVCSFGSSDEYLMIGAEKYSAGSSRGFQAGRIYFWDRQTEAPNFYIDCTMGSPKCIFNFGNIVYIIISGALYAYTGGKELIKVRTLKGTDTEYSGSSDLTEVYPNMMTIRREILLIGFPSSTTAYGIRHGIHAWGSIDKNYPNCFTYNYKIPSPVGGEPFEQYNSDSQNIRIGCVYNFSDTLFYSYEINRFNYDLGEWKTTTALALVDNDSGTSTSFMYKSLQYDAGMPALDKKLIKIGIYFNPLPENTTITPMVRFDNGEWELGEVVAGAGDTYVYLEDNRRNFHELQYGFVGTTSNDSTTPVIKQVSAEVRLVQEERKLP